MRAQTNALVTLMTVQALLGLVWPNAYRDPEWIKATWFGNDWMTLLVAVPLMWISRRAAAAGSGRAVHPAHVPRATGCRISHLRGMRTVARLDRDVGRVRVR